jgi:hypothetical protein
MYLTRLIFSIFIYSSFCYLYSQDFNIIPYLLKIERGAEDSVRSELETLRVKYPVDPNVLFLDAILTDDALKSSKIYKRILEEFPDSRYADASVYRLFNYYAIEGSFELAKKYFSLLKNNYSDSPYLKIAQNQFDLILSSKELEKDKDVKLPDTKKLTNYTFTIQAGAFVKRENAQSLKTQLEKSGVVCEVKEKNVAGTIFNVVYAGKFESRSDAENFLIILSSQFKIDGRVVEINKR